MKWPIRIGAGCAIGFILVQVFIRHEHVPRFAGLIALVLIAVGISEGIDMSRFFGGSDDDDDGGDGPFRPA